VSGPGEHPKKIWDPYISLQPLKLATSHLVHKLGLGLAYQKKTTFRTKIGGVLARDASQKNWDPLLISAIIEARNFKFGIQLGFGTILPKTKFGTKLAGGGPGEHAKKFGTPYLFPQPLKLATKKLVHNMSSGLPCQTQALGRV